MNPRRSASALRDPRAWYDLMHRMEQALADTRSMARTMAHALAVEQEWDDEARDRYVEILRQGGAAIIQADSGGIHANRVGLDELVDYLQEQALGPELWPVYGGLIINLRNILAAMDEVANANPMQQPPLPFRRPVP